MILTFTPNPSIDATLDLDKSLQPGTVNRATNVTRVAGGKGVNVSHAVHLAGAETIALFPCSATDPFMYLARASGLSFSNVEMDSSVRTNTTITEPNGRTTKANGPGPTLSARVQQDLIAELSELSVRASWVVLAGSLPSGVDDNWYETLIHSIRESNPRARIAVDTSDKYLRALSKNAPENMPNLIKPNGLEIGQLINQDGIKLEKLAQTDDYRAVVKAAKKVGAWGVQEVLVTLGSAGAVLVTNFGSWLATPPPISVKSTVGAGDSALAGFLIARDEGQDYAESLKRAVAYGAAAAALPGTTLPSPDLLNITETKVIKL